VTSDVKTLRLRPNKLVWRQVGEEVMILDTETSEYLSVNRTGTVLWPMLAEGCAKSELVKALVNNFEVEEERALADVERFLCSLGELGLLDGSATAS
jgi:predicted AAA+ superfamily ATPase